MIYQQKIFTKEECEIILKYQEKYKDIKNWFPEKNIKGQRIVHNKRLMSYEVYAITNNSETNWMFKKIMNWFTETSNVKLNTENEVMYCTMHRYEIGDRFAKHIDLTPERDSRRYNLGIQLNDDYEGGEYVCWDDDGKEILISKEPGTALAYHCRILHEIKEITKGERWSIVMPIEKYSIIEKKSIL